MSALFYLLYIYVYICRIYFSRIGVRFMNFFYYMSGTKPNFTGTGNTIKGKEINKWVHKPNNKPKPRQKPTNHSQSQPNPMPLAQPLIHPKETSQAMSLTQSPTQRPRSTPLRSPSRSSQTHPRQWKTSECLGGPRYHDLSACRFPKCCRGGST